MEQLMKLDRAAFQDLVFDHFGNVEKVTKEFEARYARLERVVDDKNTHIQELQQELAAAKEKIEESDRAEGTKQRRRLQDHSAENKENMDPTVAALKTLAREVSLPPCTPLGIPRSVSVCSTDTQIDEISQRGTGVQTVPFQLRSSPPLPCDDEKAYQQAYDGLQAKYEVVLQQYQTYKNAWNILEAKYRKDKEKWKAWLAHDTARRDRERRREGDRRGTMSPSPNVSLETINPPSSPPRPPVLSPDSTPVKSRARPMPVFDTLRNSGLFSALRSPKAIDFPWRDVPDTTNKPSGIDLNSSEPSSIPETMERDQAQLPPPFKPDASRALAGASNPASDATASDTGDETEITPRANLKVENSQEPMLLPPQFKKPWLPTEVSGTRAKPVIIKSEPQSSQSDRGYHLFEQESFDLDDVGPQESLTKRRKTDIVASEKSRNQETQCSERDVRIREEPPSSPALRGVRLDASSIEDQRPRSPQAPAAKSLRSNPQPPPSPPSPPSPPPLAPRKTPRPAHRGPITTSTPKSSKRVSRSHRNALISILEDETDGFNPVPKEAPSTRPSTRLDGLLSTPPPKPLNPSALIKDTANTRTISSKKRPHDGGGDFDMAVRPTTPKRQAKTDPIPSKRRADAPQPRQKLPPSTTNDLTSFKINPAANNGLDYAYHETVRNKDVRKCLPGCTRACCRGLGRFIEAAGLPLVQRCGPRWRSSSPCLPSSQQIHPEEQDVFVNRYGRHRDAFPRRVSPPGFWDSEMPDTQALKCQHAEADRIEKEKLELRMREAKKGDKGRFMRR